MNERKLKFSTWAELKKKFNIKKWLIKKFVAKAQTIALIAQPAAGKTLLALDMALSLATGKNWLGHKTQKSCVFYILGEGQIGVSDRIRAWEKENEICADNANFYISNISLPIDTHEGFNELVHAINVTGKVPDIIFVDTFARSLAGDENSSMVVGAFVRNCDQLIGMFNGCSVFIIHHPGISDKSRMRGSSALHAAVDRSFLLSVERDKTRILTCIKSKDEQENEPIYFKVKPVVLDHLDEDNEIVTSAVLQSISEKPTKTVSNPERELALQCLDSVVKRDGKATHETWRDSFHEALTGKKEDNVIRASFSRNKKFLLDNRLVVQSGEYFNLA
jgi:RecA-family ATPase